MPTPVSKRATRAPAAQPPPAKVASTDLAAGAELRRLIQAFVRAFGLLTTDETPCGQALATSHAHALMFLLDSAREGARPTQQTLGLALGINKSNVARLARRMESAGHLAQSRSKEDGRSRLLSLTAQGTRLAEQVERASGERYASLIGAVPLAARSTLFESLTALNHAVTVTRPKTPPSEKES
jgi:DNA-binding MarR family transcriptional regulator